MQPIREEPGQKRVTMERGGTEEKQGMTETMGRRMKKWAKGGRGGGGRGRRREEKGRREAGGGGDPTWISA